MTAREIIAVALDDIADGEGVGLRIEAHVALIAARFAAEGQLDPIWLRRNGNRAAKRWTLVAGWHRLSAARAIGWNEIAAVQVADEHSTGDDVRALQVAENLDRRDLRPIERAMHVAARYAAAEDAHFPGRVGERQSDRANHVRWNMSVKTDGYPPAIMAGGSPSDTTAIMAGVSAERASPAPFVDWRQPVAASCGCSIRQLERYLRIDRQLVQAFPDRMVALNASPAGERLADVLRIASHADPADRSRAIDVALAGTIARRGGAQERQQAAFEKRVVNNFARLTIEEKRAVQSKLIAQSPPGVIIHAATEGVGRLGPSDQFKLASAIVGRMDAGQREKLRAQLMTGGAL